MSINSIPPEKSGNMTPVAKLGIDEAEGSIMNPRDEGEVFRKGDGSVDFRTVGWPMASVIFLKRKAPRSLELHGFLISVIVMFATGVLSIPNAMYSLGMRTFHARYVAIVMTD